MVGREVNPTHSTTVHRGELHFVVHTGAWQFTITSGGGA
jgi:hypothetical protein